MSRQEPVDADWAFIGRFAPVVASIASTEENGAPVTRESRNGYDIQTDRWLHNVVERRLARVACGVKVATIELRGKRFGTDDRLERDNGDVVFYQWEIVDCYEWQQDRGEKPAIVYETDARGNTWVRHA